jgi:hypothetical protein
VVQDKQRQNPLRMFMFNQMAANHYQNPDFARAVGCVLDLLGLMIMQNNSINIELAVNEAAVKVAELLCAANLRDFPDLNQTITQQDAAAAQELLVAFDQIGQSIQQAKQQASQFQPAFQQPRMMNGGLPASWQQQPQAQVQSWGTAPHRAGLLNTGVRALPSAPRTVVQPLTNDVADVSERASYLRQPFARAQAAAAVQQAVVDDRQPVVPAYLEVPEEQAPVVAVGELVDPASGLLKWKPTQTQPYLPAYQPSKYSLRYVQESDGSVNYILIEKDPMDYDQHATTSSVFGAVPRNLELHDSADVLRRLHNDVARISEAPRTPAYVDVVAQPVAEGEEPAKIKVRASDQWVRDISEDTAWLQVNRDRLLAAEEDGLEVVPDVYRRWVILGELSVAEVDETEHVSNYAQAKTFLELREKLKGSVDEVSPGLWDIVNTRLTKMVNRVLRLNLSVGDISIDSFVEDVGEVEEALRTHYGEAAVTGFSKYQRELIQRTFCSPQDAICLGFESEFRGWFLPEVEGETQSELAPKITFVKSRYSYTQLSARAHELDLAIDPKAPNAVFRESAPVLHDLIKQIFEDAAEAEADWLNAPWLFDRHLIRTIDGRVFEASKGFLGNQVHYLLSLVK